MTDLRQASLTNKPGIVHQFAAPTGLFGNRHRHSSLAMSFFQNAVFHTTVADLRRLPADSQGEVAFAGRSNAGKSSVINTLANRSRLAFVSKTPGRTQQLNYFLLAEGKYLVDLPGYGFAQAPERVRSQWDALLAPYLRERDALRGLVLIMDSRHPLTELDCQMLHWFAPTGKPLHILLSKADKLSRQEQLSVLHEVQQALNELAIKGTVQIFSSLRKTGVTQAETVLADWLELHAAAARSPQAQLTSQKSVTQKRRSAIGWSARSAITAQKKAPGKGGAGGEACLKA